MLTSVMMTEKTRVTTNHHATGGSLGRSTVRAQPATRTGCWIPVTAFVAWLTSLMPDSVSNIFSDTEPFGAFMNAVISFLLIATVVYFFIVMPYTKAKERFFPSTEEGTPADIALLEEIRDLLAQGNRPV